MVLWASTGLKMEASSTTIDRGCSGDEHSPHTPLETCGSPHPPPNDHSPEVLPQVRRDGRESAAAR